MMRQTNVFIFEDNAGCRYFAHSQCFGFCTADCEYSQSLEVLVYCEILPDSQQYFGFVTVDTPCTSSIRDSASRLLQVPTILRSVGMYCLFGEPTNTIPQNVSTACTSVLGVWSILRTSVHRVDNFMPFTYSFAGNIHRCSHEWELEQSTFGGGNWSTVLRVLAVFRDCML